MWKRNVVKCINCEHYKSTEENYYDCNLFSRHPHKKVNEDIESCSFYIKEEGE